MQKMSRRTRRRWARCLDQLAVAEVHAGKRLAIFHTIPFRQVALSDSCVIRSRGLRFGGVGFRDGLSLLRLGLGWERRCGFGLRLWLPFGDANQPLG